MIIILSDLVFSLAWGFMAPVYSIFVIGQIHGGTLAVVGFATGLFWFVKSAVQFPVSWIADAIPGEWDDYLLMLAGATVIIAANLLYYFFATEVWHVYLFEILHGIGYALNLPAWYGIFTRHIDPKKESTEWTLDSNAFGIGYGISAAIGGVVGQLVGPRFVFLLVALVSALGTMTLLLLRNDFKRPSPDGPAAPLHRPAQS